MRKGASYFFLYEAGTPGDLFGVYAYGLARDGRIIAKNSKKGARTRLTRLPKLSAPTKTSPD